MLPILYSIGPVHIYSYGLMLATAIILCALLLKRDAGARGIPGETVYDLIFWVMAGGILGARVFYIALHWDMFEGDFKEMFMIQRGGLAFQGGLFLGTLAAVIYIRLKKIPFWMMLDLLAPYLALGQSIGRIGCFLNGCCYGRPVSWGIYFPVHHAYLHPTQLYATTSLFLVFLILKYYQKEARCEGQVLALYLMLASLQRFVIEFFRADHVMSPLGVSVFQLVSAGIFFAGLGLMIYVKKAHKARP